MCAAFMPRLHFLVIIFLTHLSHATAQYQHSVTTDSVSGVAMADTCSVPRVMTAFRAKDLILPGAFIALGASGMIDGWGRRADKIDKHEVKEWRHWNMFRWDNLIQYAPSIMGIGMNLAGVKSKFSRADRWIVRVTSFALMSATTYGLKTVIKETRPSGEDDDAFPSGHTATAFQGAELVRMEYGGWYGVAAYAMAIGVGIQRFTSDKHWVHDVVAGVGIGILSARAAYWLLPAERRLLGKWLGKKGTAAVLPYYDSLTGGIGGSFAMTF